MAAVPTLAPEVYARRVVSARAASDRRPRVEPGDGYRPRHARPTT